MTWTPLPFTNLNRDVMIGVGGIGGGLFFAMNGNHTLGREESRGGRFLDRRDYCKLHIISHYVKVFLGPRFKVIPVGGVGDDDLGRQLVAEMAETGMRVDRVMIVPGEKTSLCVCLVYPDGSGGNLTPDDSACSKVMSEDVADQEELFISNAGKGVALAVPEAPLPARRTLLQLATKHDFLRAASFVSEEIPGCLDWLPMIDVLALNADEAAVLAETSQETDTEAIVTRAVDVVKKANPKLILSVTAGSHGSWLWNGRDLDHQPAMSVEMVSTAGAGDCHFAALLTGMIGGLSMPETHRLASRAAALSVTSADTINKELDGAALDFN